MVQKKPGHHIARLLLTAVSGQAQRDKWSKQRAGTIATSMPDTNGQLIRQPHSNSQCCSHTHIFPSHYKELSLYV